MLNERLQKLDQDMLRVKIQNPMAVDLVEESFFQAIRAITDERKKHIADVVKNGLSRDDEAVITSKRLLLLLAQLDDLDIIFLIAYNRYWSQQDEFVQKHLAELTPTMAHMGSTPQEREKHFMREHRLERLEQFGLLLGELQIDSKTKQPVLESSGKSFKRGARRITPLGRMLLNYVDAE